MSEETKQQRPHDDDVKRFNPPIDAKITINAGLYLKLAQEAAQERVPTDLFCERLLEGALRDLRLFKTDWRLPMETRKEK